MRILLDLQGCQSASRLRGIGRYTLSLAKAIAGNAGEHEVWVLLSDRFPDTVMPLRQELAGLVPAQRIALFSAPGPVDEQDPTNSPRARVAELIREHAIAELRPDVVHVGSLFEGFVDGAVTSIGCLSQEVPTAVTLYDLIPLLNPERYLNNPIYRDYYQRKVESLGRASVLLAISASAGNEAVEALNLPLERVVEVGCAADDIFAPRTLSYGQERDLKQRLGLTRPFVFNLGVIEPRKNLESLIRAFALLPQDVRARHQLLLVAQGSNVARKRLRRLARRVGLKKDDLILSDHVSNDDLASLYSLCRLFVFPSLHEGFGLPALEAMQCGAPVVGSKTTSIPEVIGREDALFDPTSTAAIAQVMARALADSAFNQALRDHGAKQAKRFSWDLTARRALSAFEQVNVRRGSYGHSSFTPSLIYKSVTSEIGSRSSEFSKGYLLRVAEAISENLSTEGNRQLLVDVSELAERDAKTGIQRVTRSILEELMKNPPSGFRVEPVRFDREKCRYRYARAFSSAFSKGDPSETDYSNDWVEGHRGDVFLGLDLAADRVPLVEDWFAKLRRRGMRVSFVVYDILPIQHPDWWPPGMASMFERWLQSIAAVADLLIGISASVVDDLERWLAVHDIANSVPFAMAHFHLGANFAETIPTKDIPDTEVSVLSALRSRTTFLMVGTLEPRKGHAQVLEAFEQLWSRDADVNLVIVGSRGWMVETIAERLRAHPELGNRLFWLQGISDAYLDEVYAASACLIAASYGEGFGLPLIEAAQHRLPIIARDIPVFREVAGEHAHYFCAASATELAEAVREWLQLQSDAKAPASEGMPWLSWPQSALQLCELIVGETR